MNPDYYFQWQYPQHYLSSHNATTHRSTLCPRDGVRNFAIGIDTWMNSSDFSSIRRWVYILKIIFKNFIHVILFSSVSKTFWAFSKLMLSEFFMHSFRLDIFKLYTGQFAFDKNLVLYSNKRYHFNKQWVTSSDQSTRKKSYRVWPMLKKAKPNKSTSLF